MTLIDQIRDMIAEGNTERSLAELYNYVKENNADIIDTLVMLRNKMSYIQNEQMKGTMDDETASLERAKVNDAILKLLPQLTPEYMAQAAARKAQPQPQPQQQAPVYSASPSYPAPSAASSTGKLKWGLIGAGGLLVVFILIAVFSGGGGGEEEMDYSQPMEEEVLPASNLLESVMDAHGGQAVWLSVPNAEGLTNNFMLTENGTFQEYHDDQLFAEFQIQDLTQAYIELYDPTRQIVLRLFDADVLYFNSNDSQWYQIATGEWVTPQ